MPLPRPHARQSVIGISFTFSWPNSTLNPRTSRQLRVDISSLTAATRRSLLVSHTSESCLSNHSKTSGRQLILCRRFSRSIDCMIRLFAEDKRSNIAQTRHLISLPQLTVKCSTVSNYNTLSCSADAIDLRNRAHLVKISDHRNGTRNVLCIVCIEQLRNPAIFLRIDVATEP